MSNGGFFGNTGGGNNTNMNNNPGFGGLDSFGAFASSVAPPANLGGINGNLNNSGLNAMSSSHPGFGTIAGGINRPGIGMGAMTMGQGNANVLANNSTNVNDLSMFGFPGGNSNSNPKSNQSNLNRNSGKQVRAFVCLHACLDVDSRSKLRFFFI